MEMHTARIKRDARFTSPSRRLSLPLRGSFVSLQPFVSVGGMSEMRAQNFNYLRKISIDPWREIERPAMKRGWKAEIQTVRRRGARDKGRGGGGKNLYQAISIFLKETAC